MIGKIIQKYAGILYADSIKIKENNDTFNTENDFLSENVDEAKVMIATSLAFLTGVIHVSLIK